MAMLLQFTLVTSFTQKQQKKAKIGVADQKNKKKQIDLFDLILFATADLCLSVPSFPPLQSLATYFCEIIIQVVVLNL